MTLQGVLIEISPAVTRILGYPQEYVIGKKFSHFTSPDIQNAIEGEITKKIERPAESSRYEIPIRAWNGQEIFCEINSRLVKRHGSSPEILGVIRDTTERRRMEDAIRRSEKKYRDIFENAVEGMFQSTIKGKYLKVNHSFARILGYPSPEDLIDDITDISAIYVKPEDHYRILQLLNQHQVIQNISVEWTRKSTDHCWVTLNARLVTDKTGTYIEGSAIDITDEIQLKQALEEREKIYRILADNITDVIWTADLHMNLNYMSPSISRLRGFSVEEVTNQPLHEVYTPESLYVLLSNRRVGLEQIKKGIVDDWTPQYLELGMYHRDGRIIWTETVISLIRDAQNRPIGVVGSIRDINERKQIEYSHRKTEEQLKEAQHLAQIGNWDLNLHTGKFCCSDEVYRILELDPDVTNPSFDHFLSLIHPEDLESVTSAYHDTITLDVCAELILRIVLPENRIKHLHIRGHREDSEEGGEKIFGTIQDVSGRMRLENERGRLLEQIQLNMTELATLNDGIRNPLAIIEALLELRPEDCHEEVHTQVARIDGMVTQLDRRWIESEKVLSYLRKHYGISRQI